MKVFICLHCGVEDKFDATKDDVKSILKQAVKHQKLYCVSKHKKSQQSCPSHKVWHRCKSMATDSVFYMSLESPTHKDCNKAESIHLWQNVFDEIEGVYVRDSSRIIENCVIIFPTTDDSDKKISFSMSLELTAKALNIKLHSRRFYYLPYFANWRRTLKVALTAANIRIPKFVFLFVFLN